MCLLTIKKKDFTFSLEWIQDFLDRNGDGFGYAYAEDGVLHTAKVIPKSAKQVYKMLKPLNDKEIVFHFRMGTHGTRTIDNVHPFPVLTKEEDGLDCLMFHNGVISGYTGQTKEMSDTRQYIEQIIKPLLKFSPDLLHQDAFRQMIEEHLGNNRVVFIDNLGRITNLNAQQGMEHCGNYMSNNYAWSSHSKDEDKPEPRSFVTYGNTYDWRGYGGYAWDRDDDTWFSKPKASGKAVSLLKKADEKEAEAEVGPYDAITTKELKDMSLWDIEEMVYEAPEIVAPLITDLIDEIHWLDSEMSQAVSGF